MSYDSECLRVAEYFLSDEKKATPKDADKLAQIIQDAIESYISYELDPCERCAGSGQIARSIHFPCGYVAPGPVPDDARGVAASPCDLCDGSGRASQIQF